MWFWNGAYWQFASLVRTWYSVVTVNVPATAPPSPPRQVIHEAPIAVSEYVARIREKCD